MNAYATQMNTYATQMNTYATQMNTYATQMNTYARQMNPYQTNTNEYISQCVTENARMCYLVVEYICNVFTNEYISHTNPSIGIYQLSGLALHIRTHAHIHTFFQRTHRHILPKVPER